MVMIEPEPEPEDQPWRTGLLGLLSLESSGVETDGRPHPKGLLEIPHWDYEIAIFDVSLERYVAPSSIDLSQPAFLHLGEIDDRWLVVVRSNAKGREDALEMARIWTFA
jgi:hypothetical protein